MGRPNIRMEEAQQKTCELENRTERLKIKWTVPQGPLELQQNILDLCHRSLRRREWEDDHINCSKTNCQQFAKFVTIPKPTDSRSWTNARINSKESTRRYIIVKLLKTNDKEKSLESSERKMTPYLYGEYNSNERGFLIKTQKGQRKWHNIFQVSIQNPIASKNVLQD